MRAGFVMFVMAMVATSTSVTAVHAEDESPTVSGHDAIASTIVRELGRVQAGTGVAHHAAQLPGVKAADRAAHIKQLVAALATESLTVLAEHVESDAAILTVESKTGGRARIHLGEHRGELWIAPKPSYPSKTPGRCVKVPAVAHSVYVSSSGIDQMGEHHQSRHQWNFTTSRLADVDGDAILDAFVPVPKDRHACSEDIRYRVYVMRGACGHEVGVIGPGHLDGDHNTVAVDASGFKPLSTSARTTRIGRMAIPESTTVTRKFAIKRGRYVETSSSKSSGKCHHCSTWWCKSVK